MYMRKSPPELTPAMVRVLSRPHGMASTRIVRKMQRLGLIGVVGEPCRGSIKVNLDDHLTRLGREVAASISYERD